MGIKLTTLDNGMKVVTKQIENFSSVVLGYWTGVGGVCENDSNWGISHFLEHMAFKGTSSRTARQIAEEIESVGGYLNAYTSRETTAYHAKVLGENTDLAVNILSDILQEPSFLSEELERERGVILQELFQSRDTPDDIIFDHFQRMAFGDQALGRPIVGYEDIVSRLSAEDLRGYMAEHYNADNMVFAAAGNVSHEKLLEIADKHFSKFSTKKTRKIDKNFKYIGGNYSDIRKLEQVHVIIGFEGLSSRDPDYYTLAILSSILGEGMSSRLFQEVREKRGLVYSIYTFSSSYSVNGTFGIYAATTAEKVDEVVKVVAGELGKIREEIFDKELARTKALFRASLLMARESNASSCEQIVNQTMIFGKPLDPDEILAKIDAITAEDVLKLAKKIFAGKPSIVTVGSYDVGNLKIEKF